MNAQFQSMPELIAPARSDVPRSGPTRVGNPEKHAASKKSATQNFSTTMDKCLAERKSPPRNADKKRGAPKTQGSQQAVDRDRPGEAAEGRTIRPSQDEAQAAADESSAIPEAQPDGRTETALPLSTAVASIAAGIALISEMAENLSARLVPGQADAGGQVSQPGTAAPGMTAGDQTLGEAVVNALRSAEKEAPTPAPADANATKAKGVLPTQPLAMMAAKGQTAGTEEPLVDARHVLPNPSDGPKFAANPTLGPSALAVPPPVAGEFDSMQQDSSPQDHSRGQPLPTVGGDIAAEQTRADGSDFRTKLAVPKPVQHQILNQIVAKAALYRSMGQTEMRINIKPEFWGPLQMNIGADNHQLTIRIMTELPVVKEMIEHHVQQLKASLQDQGLEVASFDVSIMDDADDGRGHHTGARFQKQHARVDVSDPEEATVDGAAISAQRVALAPASEGRIDVFT